MRPAALVEALALPDGARVGRRVPRKALLEHGAPTAADRRLIQEGVEELAWVAVLKPSTVAVPAFRDAARDYLEISVLSAVFRPGARAGRLTELIHRAIPYPLVLVTVAEGAAELSLAPKRRSGSAADAVVVEAVEGTGPLGDPTSPVESAFAASLPLRLRPARDLYSVYEGWRDCVAALAAARVTGTFALPPTPEHADRRRAALAEHAALVRREAEIRARAARETQLGRRAELNLELQALRARLAEVIEVL